MQHRLREWFATVEEVSPILLGIVQACVGVALSLVGVLLKTPDLPWKWLKWPWIGEVLSSLGLGAIAAGVLTLTLEPITRRRHQEDVREIKEAHIGAVLKSMIPEAVAEQIQEHIIRQPFLRSDYHATFYLNWRGAKRTYLEQRLTVAYRVINISHRTQVYKVRAFEDRPVHFPAEVQPDTQIVQIDVATPGGTKKSYVGETLEPFLRRSLDRVKAEIEIPLRPGEEVDVKINSTNLVKSEDHYLFTMTGQTTNFHLTVHHPPELFVNCQCNHASDDALQPFAGDFSEIKEIKQWKVAVFLPAQGVLLEWHRNADKKQQQRQAHRKSR